MYNNAAACSAFSCPCLPSRKPCAWVGRLSTNLLCPLPTVRFLPSSSSVAVRRRLSSSFSVFRSRFYIHAPLFPPVNPLVVPLAIYIPLTHSHTPLHALSRLAVLSRPRPSVSRRPPSPCSSFLRPSSPSSPSRSVPHSYTALVARLDARRHIWLSLPIFW